MGEDGNLRNTELFLMMLCASVAAFLTVTGARFIFTVRRTQLIGGSAAAYCLFVLLVLENALTHGVSAFAETVMWLPIMVMFGIPFMAPTVTLAWCGSFLAIRINEGKPGQHARQVSSA